MGQHDSNANEPQIGQPSMTCGSV